MTELSKRAENLLVRLKEGCFYPAYDPNCPKAMAELESAGLVQITGRVEVVRACYVPAEGYTPYTQESFRP